MAVVTSVTERRTTFRNILWALQFKVSSHLGCRATDHRLALFFFFDLLHNVI